jgi:hypothetical protein
MSTTINVEGKILGQKRPIFTDWRIQLPPKEDKSGEHIRLRDLITHLVVEEVAAFRQRQEERRLARIMTPAQIEQGVQKGKVDPGERDLRQAVDIDQAISNALQSFEDGLYFVFVDGDQQQNLDNEVILHTNSKVTFIRLVALAGG